MMCIYTISQLGTYHNWGGSSCHRRTLEPGTKPYSPSLLPPQVKTFRDYVELYVKGQPVEEKEEDLPRKIVPEVVNPRWEVCVTASPCGFQQASFINSIATTKVSRNTYTYMYMFIHAHYSPHNIRVRAHAQAICYTCSILTSE